MFNNGPIGSSEPDSEVPVDLSASPEQDTEGDTLGGHGPDGGPLERQSDAVSQTLGGKPSAARDDRAMGKTT